jgi:acyl-CoA thioesterase I
VESIRYLALGDSYTIGTGLEDESHNFPTLLANRLSIETTNKVAVVNLGVNGYTTSDVIREELPVARASSPQVVSVLIGANDIVQGADEGSYRRRLQQIYDAVRELGPPAERVLTISTPDFSGLPGAAPFGSASHLRARVDAFNRIAHDEADARRFHFADITRITREPDRGGGWLAADGLHPGPAQHRAIADALWDVIGAVWTSIRSA